MYCKTIAVWIVFLSLSCKSNSLRQEIKVSSIIKDEKNKISPEENSYAEVGEIPVPQGFTRTGDTPLSFSAWLRKLPLKKNKTVYLFDGSLKNNQSAQFAVINSPVGTKDLQQCADAVMRLRATYLFDLKKFEQIKFTDNEGKNYNFTPPYNKEHFESYLQTVFGMCGTASLSKQLNKVKLNDIVAGDVFIRGGFPGHAVIVIEVVKSTNGNKKFMLAQSYMPAQDIHILLNPANNNFSPWYDVTDEESIITPEYTFSRDELKRW